MKVLLITLLVALVSLASGRKIIIDGKPVYTQPESDLTVNSNDDLLKPDESGIGTLTFLLFIFVQVLSF